MSSDAFTGSAALPRWVKEAVAVSKARGYTVTRKDGEFVVSVHPVRPRSTLLHKQAGSNLAKRDTREGSAGGQQSARNSRARRSADRAAKHALRVQADARLRQLFNRFHKIERWKLRQAEWTEWMRNRAATTKPAATAPAPHPAPAPASTEAEASELAYQTDIDYDMQDNRGSKRAGDSPPRAPPPLEQPSKSSGKKKKPKPIAATLDAAAAAPPPAAAPPTYPCLTYPNAAYPVMLAALIDRRRQYRTENDAVQEGLSGVHLASPCSPHDREGRSREMRQLVPSFGLGRLRDKGYVCRIVEGDCPLPPDLIKKIVDLAGQPQEPPT